MEEQALSKEKDALSRTRLQEVRRELAALEEALAPLQMRYWQEKERVQAMRRWGEGGGAADALLAGEGARAGHAQVGGAGDTAEGGGEGGDLRLNGEANLRCPRRQLTSSLGESGIRCRL